MDGTGGKRERTRSALIKAALAVVETRGFAGASLDEIAAHAGMTKGAIYSNFGGKADLMFAMAEAESLRLTPEFTPGAGLPAQLQGVAVALMAMLPTVACKARLSAEFQIYLMTERELRLRAARQMEQMLEPLAAAIGARYGGELTMAPESLLMAIQALCLGFVHQHQLTPEAVTETAVREAFAALAAGAVR